MDVIRHAFVREVSRALEECELTHLPRAIFDLQLARAQHEQYVRALRSAGVEVKVLPEEPKLADSAFVEDPILIFEQVAVLCRPGALSRKSETDLMEREVQGLRSVFRISAPGTLEGGDVLKMGEKLFVGLSSRTNQSGIEQLRRLLSPLAYEVIEVVVKGCLHLKTGATSPGKNMLLLNPAWIDRSVFREYDICEVPDAEPWGANTLSLNGRVFVAASAPRTAEILSARGLDVHLLDISELQKAEAGLTCLSVLFS